MQSFRSKMEKLKCVNTRKLRFTKYDATVGNNVTDEKNKYDISIQSIKMKEMGIYRAKRLNYRAHYSRLYHP